MTFSIYLKLLVAIIINLIPYYIAFVPESKRRFLKVPPVKFKQNDTEVTKQKKIKQYKLSVKVVKISSYVLMIAFFVVLTLPIISDIFYIKENGVLHLSGEVILVEKTIRSARTVTHFTIKDDKTNDTYRFAQGLIFLPFSEGSKVEVILLPNIYFYDVLSYTYPQSNEPIPYFELFLYKNIVGAVLIVFAVIGLRIWKVKKRRILSEKN